MKHLIAALFVLTTAAISTAQELQVAGFKNNVDGWTIITNRNERCGSRDMYDGYAYGAGGANLTQLCWLIRGDKVLAVLETGEPLLWSVRSFETLEFEPDVQEVTGVLIRD
jgi:hypothetical protein